MKYIKDFYLIHYLLIAVLFIRIIGYETAEGGMIKPMLSGLFCLWYLYLAIERARNIHFYSWLIKRIDEALEAKQK